MPRSRPGALRTAPRTAVPRTRTRAVPRPARIRGLSARTSLAIHHLEYEDGNDLPFLFPGATALALHRYREFVKTPGRRILYPRPSVCPGCPGCGLDDVRNARDVLDDALRLLPPRPRGELARTVRALDRRYMDRTLPDPRPQRAPWWHHRLGEGAEGW